MGEHCLMCGRPVLDHTESESVDCAAAYRQWVIDWAPPEPASR